MHDYVRYDEIEDVLTSTDLLALVTPRLNREPLFWKWAVVAAHNALQGAIVCALHDCIGISVLTNKSGRAVLNWQQQNSQKEYPRERLEIFWGLVWRFCRQNSAARNLVTRSQLRDIRRLSLRRNEFEHFIPKGWSIEKAYLSRIVGTAIDFIELAMQHDKVTYRLTEHRARRLKSNLSTGRDGLRGLSSPVATYWF